MGQMKQAQESAGGFSCQCSHANSYFSEESLFQLEISILSLSKGRVNWAGSLCLCVILSESEKKLSFSGMNKLVGFHCLWNTYPTNTMIKYKLIYKGRRKSGQNTHLHTSNIFIWEFLLSLKANAVHT